jgi:hypothetical protein
MATGGWTGLNGKSTTTVYTFASYSLPVGLSSLFMASGKAILLEVPTQSNLTEMKNPRSKLRWTLMTSGLTTLSTD